MEEIVTKLELQLKSLVERFEQLKVSNASLKRNQVVLVREREALLAKNKLAVTQIENMVARLKSIEQLS